MRLILSINAIVHVYHNIKRWATLLQFMSSYIVALNVNIVKHLFIRYVYKPAKPSASFYLEIIQQRR